MRPDPQATSPLTVRTHSTAMGAHTTTPHTHDHRVKSPPRIMQPRQALARTYPHSISHTNKLTHPKTPHKGDMHTGGYRHLVGGSCVRTAGPTSAHRAIPAPCAAPPPRNYPQGHTTAQIRASRIFEGPRWPTHPTPNPRQKRTPPAPHQQQPPDMWPQPRPRPQRSPRTRISTLPTSVLYRDRHQPLLAAHTTPILPSHGSVPLHAP